MQRQTSYRLGVLPAVLLASSIALWAGQGRTSAAEPPALTAQPPIVVPRAAGAFDYMTVDDRARRLLVAHPGSRTLDVIDLNNGTVTQQVSVGEAHGVAVDVKDGKYFVGASRQPALVVIGRKFVVKNDQIAMDGPIDAIAFDTKNGSLYADRVDNGSVVVLNGKTNRQVAAIAVGTGLEYIEYDPVSDKVYQNVVSTGSVAVIDPSTNRVTATWRAAPAADLRGLAVDGANHRLFSAGGNGKLAVLDTNSGALVASVDIAPSVDQIAFDPVKRRLYCASGTGVLSVVAETETGAELIANITVPRRAHNVTIDPKTHAVWISYGTPDNDYVMKLVPPA
ncbi:MAG: YncE family protein [Candidatus Eremiobacteraeota bacterium]|nr:YncE family protein [Candidatus Eremiobacteraeota bacterium]